MSDRGECWNIIVYRNEKSGPFYCRMLQRIPIILKNASNKSCVELIFLQKNSENAYLYLTQGYSKGAPMIVIFEKI